MPPAKSALSYADVRDVLDRALESEKGISITRPTKGMAVNFRHRCYSFIKIQRAQSASLYAEGDIRRDTTPYDGLAMEVEENVLFLRKRSGDTMQIEEL